LPNYPALNTASAIDMCLTLTPSLGMTSCEYPNKLYLSRK